MVWNKRPASSRGGGRLKSRIRLEKPTAQAQQKQLQTLARLAVKNARILNDRKTVTDWVDSRNVALAAGGSIGTWYSIALMQPTSWTRVARKNEDYLNQGNTLIRDLNLEYFMGQGDKSKPVIWTLFVVTVQPNATWDSGVTFQAGQEYIEMGTNNSPQLNSGIFKVHAVHKRRTLVTYPDGGNQELVAHNDRSAYNGQIRLNLNVKIRSPEDSNWTQTSVGDLPRHQRFYLVVNAKSEDTEATSVKFQFGAKFTAINSD